MVVGSNVMVLMRCHFIGCQMLTLVGGPQYVILGTTRQKAESNLKLHRLEYGYRGYLQLMLAGMCVNFFQHILNVKSLIF